MQSWLPAAGISLGLSKETLRLLPPALGRHPLQDIGEASFASKAVCGWRGGELRQEAARRGLPYFTLDEGPLRGTPLGGSRQAILSVALDDLGLFDDSSSPSRLEALIASGAAAGMKETARELSDLMIRHGLTIRGSLLTGAVQTPRKAAHRTIVIAAEAWQSRDLVKQALDVDGATVLSDDDASPHALLAAADEVWTVASPFGFDALMRGKKVRCFGTPFYAGWGLTEDIHPLERRKAARPNGVAIEEIVAACLVAYPLYMNPTTGAEETVFDALHRLRKWRDYASLWRGMTRVELLSPRKRRVLKAYCEWPGGEVSFLRSRAARPARDLRWGMAERPPAAEPPLVNVEDGFLRSVGLGSKGAFPLSLCFDRRGMYFDATRTNDLEVLLETADFTDELLARARALRQSILAAGISKYNLGGSVPNGIRASAAAKEKLLVVAQVPRDKSIVHGMVTSPDNIDLLRRVRADNPAAYIVFKEHPDLVAGTRRGKTPLGEARKIADAVVAEGDAKPWIDFCDAIHVRTSLAGFEALMRGKRAVCHGLPFFAGWGLTEDKVRCLRRSRRLTLDHLVAGALILYPTYLHPTRHVPIEAEDAVFILGAAATGRRFSDPSLLG